ncbi:MAG TPA: glycosyltransferase family 39 protein, partial [Planctomycetaceae bacterium]|nr:glycosyltransferase family 39 protein [Planctomycetaceae bacterium]
MKSPRFNRTADPRAPVPAPQSSAVSRADRVSLWPLLALLGTLVVTSAIRLRLLSMPLERDEGEYAYAGQLILQGHPPYERLYNMKWPGTYYCYALFEALFGQSIEGIHLGVLAINLIAIVLVFLICRRLLDAVAAAAAAVAYALLSLSPGTLGFAGHATHFVVLFGLAGILCLQRAFERQRLAFFFLAGLFAGLAPLMKQPGIVFTGFVAAFWAWQEVRSASRDWRQTGGLLVPDYLTPLSIMLTSLWPTRREWRQTMLRGAVLIAGILLPFVVLLVSLWASHTLGAFSLWTISYARYYGEPLNGHVFRNFLDSFRLVVGDGILFWVVAGLGLLALPLNSRTRAAAPFLLGLLFCSFLGVLPGLTFREHYFIVMLPAVALLVGAAVSVTRGRLLPRFPSWATASTFALVLIPLSTACGMEGAFYFWLTPDQACRHV